MIELLNAAIERRSELLASLHSEGSNCYRVFHGTNEGVAGLTVDRYGPQLLIQTFHQPIDAALVERIHHTVDRALGEALVCVYNDRSERNSRRSDAAVIDHSELVGQELGVNYLIKGKHRGQDPLLFLDMRAGRRWVQQHAAGKSVLNLFAYTCGVGVVAAAAGAREVLNVDFATRSLDVGRRNAELNGLSAAQIGFLQSDFFTAAKQLAGLPIKQRVRRGQQANARLPASSRSYPRLDEKQFDLVFLDPPRWAKSSFGTVDLIRDYPSVLKPSLLATRQGGQLVCANNVASVALDDWLDVVKRCASKAGRAVQGVDIITPEADFPSSDGRYPLKLAVLQL